MLEGFNGPIIVAGISAIALMISVVLVHRLTLSRENRADQRAVQREAASALTEALQQIRRVVEHSALAPAKPESIFEAVSSWESVYRKYATRIPRQARHARRSVAAALGEHFGAVGTSNLLPEAANYAITKHDPVWWDNADFYLSYLIDRLSRWYDNPHTAHKLTILNFDTWLALRHTT